jgi:hypothetical protein
MSLPQVDTGKDVAEPPSSSTTQYGALRSGTLRFLDLAPADRLLAYLRPGATAADDILVLLTWSGAPLEARLPAGWRRRSLFDLLGSRSMPGTGTLTLPPYGLRMLLQR